MNKEVYFGKFDGDYWPSVDELEPYFLAPKGREWFYSTGNDSAGISLQGIDGTEQLDLGDRLDLDLSMWGNPDHGVLLMYHRYGVENGELYYSKGDMSKIKTWVRSLHDTPLPVGLFIPFPQAWLAVKDFMETEGGRSKQIEWVAADDLPDNTFPDP